MGQGKGTPRPRREISIQITGDMVQNGLSHFEHILIDIV